MVKVCIFQMQAVSLLHMNSGKVSDEYVKQLNSMLQQAKNEAKELQEKVKNYQKNEVSAFVFNIFMNTILKKRTNNFLNIFFVCVCKMYKVLSY